MPTSAPAPYLKETQRARVLFLGIVEEARKRVVDMKRDSERKDATIGYNTTASALEEERAGFCRVSRSERTDPEPKPDGFLTKSQGFDASTSSIRSPLGSQIGK